MAVQTNQPNIVYFFTDQQRWDTVGCYGQPLDITPNLDRMAAEGVKFENAFTCQPVCGPARACIQTGKFATEVGCYTNHRLLPVEEDTIAKHLNRAGYDTAYIGKWHLASCGERGGPDDFRTHPVPPERRGGYQYWLASDTLEFTSHSYDGYMFDGDGNTVEFTPGRYRADFLTDKAIEYIENHDPEKPFFLFVSYIEPHHQNDNNCYEGPKGSKERFKDFPVPGDLEDTGGDWRENYPDYLGCVNSLDYNLGRIRDTLDKLGISENTVVLYTSDHGSHFRTRNGEYKRACHEGCVRIPLVASGPGFKGGRVVTELAGLIDTPATVLRAAGVDPPETMRGLPLQDVVGGRPENWRDEVYIQISESHNGRAIRTEKWKYSVRAPEDQSKTHDNEVYVEDFLYDLETDPHEKNNLVSDPEYADVRAEMAERLIKRIVEAGEVSPKIVPAEEEK